MQDDTVGGSRMQIECKRRDEEDVGEDDFDEVEEDNDDDDGSD